MLINKKNSKVHPLPVKFVKVSTQNKFCSWRYDMFSMNLNMPLSYSAHGFKFLKNILFIMLHLLLSYCNKNLTWKIRATHKNNIKAKCGTLK